MIILKLMCRGDTRGCTRPCGHVEVRDGRYLATLGEVGALIGPVDLEEPGAALDTAGCGTHGHEHRTDLARLLAEARGARNVKKPKRIPLPVTPAR